MQNTSVHIRATIDAKSWETNLWVNQKRIDPKHSQAVEDKSPDGFAWGYLGSGPSQMALAICLELFGNPGLALALMHPFKEAFVSRWPQKENVNQTIDLTDFLIDNRYILAEFEEPQLS